jgi:hypothetical protein
MARDGIDRRVWGIAYIGTAGVAAGQEHSAPPCGQPESTWQQSYGVWSIPAASERVSDGSAQWPFDGASPSAAELAGDVEPSW